MSRPVPSRVGVALAASGFLVLVGGASAWADPTPAAAAPVVDISVERTLSTPTNVFPMSPTRPSNIDITLANRGTAAQDAEFSFTVPTGWTVTPTYPPLESDETCQQTGDTYTCTVTALPAGQGRSTQLLVTAAAGTPVGSTTTVVVSGGPIGAVDSDPTNNTTEFRFQDVGTSAVTSTVAQSSTTVTPGGTVDFTITLTNNGPDRTVGNSAFIHVLTTTPDAVKPLPPTGPGLIQEGGDADAPIDGPSFSWTIDLDPGQSATLHQSWQGAVLGATAVLEVRSSHDPSNSGPDANVVETARSQPVTVAAAATTPPAGNPPTGPAGRGPVLAATGTPHVAAVGGLGGGLVLLGAVTVAVGRRRPRSR